jgi:TRAP-type transport system small permease protein
MPTRRQCAWGTNVPVSHATARGARGFMEGTVMPFLQIVDRAIGAACRFVLYLTMAVVFVILATNVALRYAAGSSLSWASELPELLFPWLIMAGVVLAAQHGSHIAVVILTQRLGSARRWVLLFSSMIVAGLYAALAIVALPLAEIAADEHTPILHVPGSFSVWCLMLGFSLLSVVTLCRLPEIWSGVGVSHGNGECVDAGVQQEYPCTWRSSRCSRRHRAFR